MAALRRAEIWGLPVSLAALALVRTLPEGTVSLYLRLAAATIVLLYPGYLAAIALGRRSFSASMAASLGMFGGCLGVMFLLESSLSFALLLYLGCGLVALGFAWWRNTDRALRGSIWVLLAGVALGLLLWRVAGVLHGDQLFHLARTRKLLELGSLDLDSLNEFKDGGLHPGYAFPLWHGVLAAIAKIAGVDPGVVVLHESSILAPAALLIAFEAGWALFRSLRLAACALIAQIALVVIAPGHGGTYAWLALPGTAGRHLLLPMVFALFFLELDRSSWPGLLLAGLASLELAVVHVTYAIYSIALLSAYVIVRRLVAKHDLRAGALALSAVSIPAIAFMAILVPLVEKTASFDPDVSETDRAIEHYGSQIVTYGGGRYALAPEMLVRWGAVTVAGIVLTALAFMAAKRRWSAFVLGGSLAVCLLTLLPWLFTPLSDLTSISQARRLALFYPYAFAFAGGLGILAGLLRRYTLVLALAAGTALQLAWPGDFGYRLHSGGGPGWLVWIALGAIGVALVFYFLSPEADFDDEGGSNAVLGAALFALPVVLAGLFYWTPLVDTDRAALTPGLEKALRQEVPERAVVLATPETSYRILAAAPVYAVTSPPGHVADTELNRPYARRKAFLRFLATGDLATVSRYRPQWVVLDRVRARRLALELTAVYRDERYVLYRIPPSG